MKQWEKTRGSESACSVSPCMTDLLCISEEVLWLLCVGLRLSQLYFEIYQWSPTFFLPRTGRPVSAVTANRWYRAIVKGSPSKRDMTGFFWKDVFFTVSHCSLVTNDLRTNWVWGPLKYTIWWQRSYCLKSQSKVFLVHTSLLHRI